MTFMFFGKFQTASTVPTPEEYRVPRVTPGVTASKLFPPLLPSLATPGPPLPYRPLQKARYYCPRSCMCVACAWCMCG